jgi:predicted  nucleic acid-binding Zn-ribbon protein
VKTKKPSKAKQLEKRISDLEQILSSDFVKKVHNVHNIEGDVLTFNDRLMAIQNELTPTEKLKEMQDQCVKMVRRVNKTHGELFKARSLFEVQISNLSDSYLALTRKVAEITDRSNKNFETAFTLIKNNNSKFNIKSALTWRNAFVIAVVIGGLSWLK